MGTVSSPLGSFSNNSNSSTFFLIYSSYIFVISLQKTIFLPVKFFFISGMILLIFLGEIKKTREFSNSENFFNLLDNSCFFSGKKPQNKNLSENPVIETAVTTAEGPGIGKILISLSMHSLINIEPGSEILGVPASDIKEIIFPDLRYSIIFTTFFFSLNLWFEMSFDFI